MNSSPNKKTVGPPGVVPKTQRRNQALSFFFGGLLPVIIFTLIEENYGTLAGLVAGMIFGIAEIIFEWIQYHKVNRMTWIGNGLLIALGSISLISSDGLWFKLQPALIEGVLAIALWGSLIIRKNLLVLMAEQQGLILPDFLKKKMNGLVFRIGCFFCFHTFLATWAAFYWSTRSWALLKGVGFTGSFILYMLIEAFFLKSRN